MGFVSLYTTHLGFGGQEVVVVGLTTEGMKRTSKPSNNSRREGSDSDSVKKVENGVKGVGKGAN